MLMCFCTCFVSNIAEKYGRCPNSRVLSSLIISLAMLPARFTDCPILLYTYAPSTSAEGVPIYRIVILLSVYTVRDRRRMRISLHNEFFSVGILVYDDRWLAELLTISARFVLLLGINFIIREPNVILYPTSPLPLRPFTLTLNSSLAKWKMDV